MLEVPHRRSLRQAALLGRFRYKGSAHAEYLRLGWAIGVIKIRQEVYRKYPRESPPLEPWIIPKLNETLTFLNCPLLVPAVVPPRLVEDNFSFKEIEEFFHARDNRLRILLTIGTASVFVSTAASGRHRNWLAIVASNTINALKLIPGCEDVPTRALFHEMWATRSDPRDISAKVELWSQPLVILHAILGATEDGLRVQKEIAAMEGIFNKAEVAGRLEMHTVYASTLRTLRDCLQGYKPDILHISGHGSTDAIFAEDRTGSHSVRTGLHRLARICNYEAETNNLACVVLNACHLAGYSQDMADHVGTAIATSGGGDLRFFEAFYVGLARRMTVAEAFDAASDNTRYGPGEGCIGPDLKHRKQQPNFQEIDRRDQEEEEKDRWHSAEKAQQRKQAKTLTARLAQLERREQAAEGDKVAELVEAARALLDQMEARWRGAVEIAMKERQKAKAKDRRQRVAIAVLIVFVVALVFRN